MGDMADMLIEQGFMNMWDEDFPATRACKFCDERDLHWEFVTTWRLFNDLGEMHSCKEHQ